MIQQYYSTAAYRSLRLYFNKNLPDIRTLQMWYNTVDGSPGTHSSFFVQFSCFALSDFFKTLTA